MCERHGISWSRSRARLWAKGETSGNTQTLLRVEMDCDRDALRFVVRQHGAGFCHRATWSCWPRSFDLSCLDRTLQSRILQGAASSGTVTLLADEMLLRSKLIEEAAELAGAVGPEHAEREAADLLYFALVALRARGGSFAGVLAELERRRLRVRRRPMQSNRGERE